MGIFDIFKYSKKEDPLKSNKPIVDPLLDLFEKSYNDPGFRPHFYKMLLSSELIVLNEKSTSDEIKLRSLPDGKVPIFSSTDRLFDNNIITSEVSFLGIKGRDLLELTQGDTLILNPF